MFLIFFFFFFSSHDGPRREVPQRILVVYRQITTYGGVYSSPQDEKNSRQKKTRIIKGDLVFGIIPFYDYYDD